MIKLIGLTGKARSGKDTVGDYLTMYNYETYAMASPIKEACRAAFGWTDEHLFGDLKEVVDPLYGITPREAMQKMGTEFGRDMINPKLWELRAKQQIDSTEYLVITDLRFDNEALLVLKSGGIVLNIERDTRDVINGVEGHSSEDGISKHLITRTIKNNGSLVDLYDRVKVII